jgi:hypothetical protein
MKIHQLPYGARFLYQGEEYVKTGPMFGTGKDGQKIFPRYLVLQPLDEQPAAVPNKVEVLPKEAVLKAFETFYAECKSLIGGEDQGEALNSARKKFLKAFD